MLTDPRNPTVQAEPGVDVNRELAELREANSRLRALLDASKLNAIVATDDSAAASLEDAKLASAAIRD